ncbi:Mor transcription activator family protein [Undibacterium sp.]|uniref:Mor transcription activator family protein n=1 Tax=Undibacterium sp. TaxID=1914977 RepID=UPI00272FE2D5|nr:Mor transcription activator family protein [Undibacterium sp.]MDP1980496.1 Mor transcription activator family protein [Undibacterium sp.]
MTQRDPEATIKLLVSMIGEAAAIRLMDAKNFGGGSFDFPKSETGLGAQTFAALAEVVGMQSAQRLCNHFGGERLYIPNLAQQYRQERNKNIVTKYNTGSTVRELMREYGLSDRRVWEILKTTDMNQVSQLSKYVQESLF